MLEIAEQHNIQSESQFMLPLPHTPEYVSVRTIFVVGLSDGHDICI